MKRQLRYRKKSQAWSFDIIIGVILFVGAFLAFYVILKQQTEEPVDTLREEAELIASELLSESSPLNVVENGKINEEKLQQLIGNYPTLKSQVRVKSDFCIYLEDQEGNVIYISQDITGIGSPIIKISQIRCS